MRDYIFETYINSLETRFKDLKAIARKLDKVDSNEKIQKAFSQINLELHSALASVLLSLDIAKEAFKNRK